MKNNIFITKPFLPPLDEYIEYLEKIWESKHLTNNGPFHQQFEKALSDYLGVKYLSLVNNATIGLILAQKALKFHGEIITTPYSFIATGHSIIWNGLEPVFVDTDNTVGNLDPDRVEEAISNKTGGILAVHNYGFPGEVDALKRISEKYNLPLIYDAAPSIGVRYHGETILKHGDLAVLSFHATKVFTTFEGGAIISRSAELKNTVDSLKNFAIINPEKVSGLGINGKMNEAEAAMGLLQLKYIDKNISKRKDVYELYINSLESINNIKILNLPKFLKYNYAYFPVFFNEGIVIRDKIYTKLQENNINCRKYWYPLISDHDIYSKCKKYELTNSIMLSENTLSLPIYADLDKDIIMQIINIIKKNI